MLRSFLPFILALIGLSIIFFAFRNPLFEWQISEVVTDFPSSYKVSTSSSPWVAGLGDSLNEKSYVFRKMSVSENGKGCSINHLAIVVNRSEKDELLERLSLARQFNSRGIDWPIWWVLIEIALSVAYSLWFTIWHEHRPISHAIISAAFATVCFCFILIPVIMVMSPRIGFWDGTINCHGTVMFSAKLSKIYYWVPLLFAGILAELAALAIMMNQVAVAASKRRKSSKSSVG